MREATPTRRWGTLRVLLVANLLLLAFVVQSILVDRRENEAHAEALTQNLALTLQYRIHNDLDIISLALEHLADRYRSVADLRHWEHALTEEKARLTAVIAMRATDAAGNVLYGLDASAKRGASIADREYFARLRDRADAGVLYAVIPVSHFAKVFEGLRLGREGSVAVRDGDLRLIARVPALAEETSVGSTRIGENFRRALQADPQRGTYHTEATSIDGIPRLHSYRRDETYGFIVNSGAAESDYLAGWYALIRQNLLIVALLFAVSVFVVRRVLKHERDEAAAPRLRFTIWNAAMTTLTGYTIEEINRGGWYLTKPILFATRSPTPPRNGTIPPIRRQVRDKRGSPP